MGHIRTQKVLQCPCERIKMIKFISVTAVERAGHKCSS